MKLPRDIGGRELSQALARYGYRVVHQTGSHIKLTSVIKDKEHHVTIPAHRSLKTGTLNSILNDVATYLEIDRSTLMENLFR